MDILDRLLGHNSTAFRQLLELSRGLSEEQLDRKFPIGLGSVRATIHHILESFEWWTDLMLGKARRKLAEDAMTLGGLEARFEKVSAELAEVARRKQREGKLDEHWAARPPEQEETHDYGNTVVHALTHAAHHRAQWMFLLKQLGVEGIPTAQALRWEARPKDVAGTQPGTSLGG